MAVNSSHWLVRTWKNTWILFSKPRRTYVASAPALSLASRPRLTRPLENFFRLFTYRFFSQAFFRENTSQWGFVWERSFNYKSCRSSFLRSRKSNLIFADAFRRSSFYFCTARDRLFETRIFYAISKFKILLWLP